MGNAQLVGNGNMIVGWGSEPFITEFAPDGRVLLDIELPKGGMNYCAFRMPWTGVPTTKPSVAVRGRWVYVSWNGATEVRSWRLDAGRSARSLETAGLTLKDGFETRLPRPPGTKVFVVTALDGSGKPLGRSRTVTI
jgi:hypothetical protein